MWTLQLLISIASVVMSCSGDTTGLASHNSSQLYWAFRLSQHAMNMAVAAPYNTFRLTTTAYNAIGDTLPKDGSVVYSVSDSTVTVDSTGLLTARYVTNSYQNTQVVASLTMQGQTIADTVVVHVTATPPVAPLAMFSIQPVAGDSAKQAVYSGSNLDVGFTVNIQATDRVGNELSFGQSYATSYVAYFTSSKPLSVAPIEKTSGNFGTLNPGHVTFYATTWAYGVVKQDSLQYVIGYPLYSAVNVVQRENLGSRNPIYFLSPPIDTIGTGGQVRFINDFGSNINIGVAIDTLDYASVPVDIIFDDSLDVSGGNILADTLKAHPGMCTNQNDNTTYPCLFSGDAVRTFPVAKSYPFHSSSIGASGIVVVSAGP